MYKEIKITYFQSSKDMYGLTLLKVTWLFFRHPGGAMGRI